MIGPSRSVDAGRDALPRVRRRASIGREQAHKKGENKQKGLQRLLDAQRRSRGSASLPRHSRRNACLMRNAGSRRSASLVATAPILFYRSERQPLYKLFLGKPAKHHDRSDRQQRSRRKLRPEKPFWTRIGSDKRGQWRRVCTRKVDAPESLVPRKDDQDQRGRRKSR